MTVDQMDAELAHMRAHLRWLCEDTIRECEEELAQETSRYHREFLQRQLDLYRTKLKQHQRAA
jgi:hypothetical protein